MKNARLLFLIQCLVIPIVIIIFRMPAEKRVLSLIANSVFLTVSLLAMTFCGPQKIWVRAAGWQFLLVAVLPITTLRIMTWNGDFKSETLFGIAGEQWHAFSNYSFLLMMLITLMSTLIWSLKLFQRS